jgi:hypothetical protein
MAVNYCAHCGQATVLRRIDGHYIAHEVQHILHLEHGFLATVVALFTHPGRAIHQYLREDRRLLVKPILFIIVTSLLYSVANHFFHIEEQYVAYAMKGVGTAGLMLQWITDNYGYANILMGAFIAVWLKLLFRSSGYGFFEMVIVLCYVMGMGMLVFALFAVLQGLTHRDLLGAGGVLGLVYSTYALGQFFDRKRVGSYAKGLFAYLLGSVMFFVLVLVLGFAIDRYL